MWISSLTPENDYIQISGLTFFTALLDEDMTLFHGDYNRVELYSVLQKEGNIYIKHLAKFVKSCKTFWGGGIYAHSGCFQKFWGSKSQNGRGQKTFQIAYQSRIILIRY